MQPQGYCGWNGHFFTIPAFKIPPGNPISLLPNPDEAWGPDCGKPARDDVGCFVLSPASNGRPELARSQPKICFWVRKDARDAWFLDSLERYPKTAKTNTMALWWTHGCNFYGEHMALSALSSVWSFPGCNMKYTVSKLWECLIARYLHPIFVRTIILSIIPFLYIRVLICEL